MFQKKCILFLFFILLSAGFVYSQDINTKRQLAQEYYRNKEYEKAAELYSDLYNISNSKVYFNYYINSLLEIEDFKKAEKVIKQQIKAYKSDMTYHVELGNLYKKTGEINKAQKEFDYAINNVNLDHQQIVRLANSFMSKREFDYAEKLYLDAAKRLGDFYNFDFELANLYYYARNFEKMINVYLSILVKSDSYIQTVQNRLQNTVYGDVNNNLSDLLKTKLIEHIQQYPDKIVFNELLIWLYSREKQYDRAMIQVKALDNRYNEDGERYMALANLATNDKYYDIAVKCYDYVILKGKENYYYYQAITKKLEILFNQIVVDKKFVNQDVIKLEESYHQSINELGLNANTANMVINLSFLEAFYLNKTQEALSDLNRVFELRNISSETLYKAKMTFADIKLFTGKVWDATLLYAEIELYNKDNPIGYEAKYKKAKLAFYIGDFVWAKAQLDVLKASTSKLIANDAFALSKLIEDNTLFEDNDEALQQFARADLLFYQKQDSLAVLSLDSTINNFSGHPILAESHYLKATIFEQNHNYEEATINYLKIVQSYPESIKVDDALFRLAEIYSKKLNDSEKAMEFYKQLFMNHKESAYSIDAKETYRQLRGN